MVIFGVELSYIQELFNFIEYYNVLKRLFNVKAKTVLIYYILAMMQSAAKKPLTHFIMWHLCEIPSLPPRTSGE